MNPPSLIGADEGKVRAARRFGRIGLVMTVAWMLAVPAFVLTFAGPTPVEAWPLYLLYLAALALHLWRIRQLIRTSGRRAPLWFVLVASGVGLGIALVGLANGFTGFVWSLVAGVLLGDIVGGLRARWITVWVLTAVAVVLAAGYAISAPSYVGTGLSPWFGAGAAAFYVALTWTIDVERLWWLKAVTDLDGSRRTAADLATARERLRLADDLHDILGHALEVVAFKSELAARLQSVDGERARTELEEVQRVARSSLAEVRALVRDTRSTDLVAELAGARAVLDSTDIELVVRGDPTTVDPTARHVLGRVLREAMTNVLRHSQPNRCTIEIEVIDGDATLRVVNDGPLPSAGSDRGTGLVALRRYLDDHAGRLDAGLAPDGTFRLCAVLPGAGR